MKESVRKAVFLIKIIKKRAVGWSRCEMRHTGAKTSFLEGVTDFGFIISKEGLAGVWKVQEKERVLDASVIGKVEDAFSHFSVDYILN